MGFDVTPHVRRGPNLVEIQVVGTLKNTLGPHHGNPGVGSAWPGMFHQGPGPGPPPGDEYHTLGYGLFEPFPRRNPVESLAPAIDSLPAPPRRRLQIPRCEPQIPFANPPPPAILAAFETGNLKCFHSQAERRAQSR
jgi:hypothetical protein